MRLSARFLWFSLDIDTSNTTDLVDVEHVATVTAYNTAQREIHAYMCDCEEDDS